MSGADNNENTENEFLQDDYEQENFVSIQDYTGEGYTLRDSREETGQIAEENRETVVEAVEGYFIDNYAVEVKVNNIVSAADGVSVFVESIDEPFFYSYAVVPIDIENENVEVDNVWSEDGHVENGIKGGLYVMAFEEEFSNLDAYVENITKESPLVGRTIDSIANVSGSGYETPYYSITAFGEVFDELYNRYRENPNITKEELAEFFNENNFKPRYLSVTVEFFMKEEDIEPDQEVFDKIVNDIEELNGIPSGEYSVSLNDNYIDKKRGIGRKDNSLIRSTPDKIVKQ
ncbi:hypothetical protein GCM10028868_36410 [Virgibacillus kimchii]